MICSCESGFEVPIPTSPLDSIRIFSLGLSFSVVHKAKNASVLAVVLKSASLPTLINAEVLPACLNLIFESSSVEPVAAELSIISSAAPPSLESIK